MAPITEHSLALSPAALLPYHTALEYMNALFARFFHVRCWIRRGEKLCCVIDCEPADEFRLCIMPLWWSWYPSNLANCICYVFFLPREMWMMDGCSDCRRVACMICKLLDTSVNKCIILCSWKRVNGGVSRAQKNVYFFFQTPSGNWGLFFFLRKVATYCACLQRLFGCGGSRQSRLRCISGWWWRMQDARMTFGLDILCWRNRLGYCSVHSL